MARRISYRNLPQMLLHAREGLLCNFRHIHHHYGLTDQQWRVMRTLSEEQELEPREICEACNILSPSLAGVLARMEKMGVIEKERMAEDQRRVLVRLTPKGEQVVADVAPLVEAQYQELEKVVGVDLVKTLYEVLDQVISTCKRETIPRVALPPGDAVMATDDAAADD
jgi:homoprotocatechuate degradation regulator HpaR